VVVIVVVKRRVSMANIPRALLLGTVIEAWTASLQIRNLKQREALIIVLRGWNYDTVTRPHVLVLVLVQIIL